MSRTLPIDVPGSFGGAVITPPSGVSVIVKDPRLAYLSATERAILPNPRCVATEMMGRNGQAPHPPA